jgi:hypothetical protein
MKHQRYSMFQSIQELEAKIFELAELYSTTDNPIIRNLINNEIEAAQIAMRIKTKEVIKQYHIKRDGTIN